MNKLKFKYIVPFFNQNFFKPLIKGMNEAARMFNVDVEFTGTTDADCGELIKIINEAVNEGCDGLAISIAHPTDLNETIVDVMNKGVPVVVFNADSDECKYKLSSICQSYYHAGVVVGKLAAKSLCPVSKILLTMHDDVDPLRQRLEGIKSILKDYPAKEIITGNTPELAAQAILQELSLNEDLAAVICTGQSDTHGAGIAAQRIGKERKVYVAGFDLCEDILAFVRDGVIDFTIDQQPYVQGFYPIVQLYFYVKYGLAPSNIDAGANVINRNNVEKVITMQKQGYR